MIDLDDNFAFDYKSGFEQAEYKHDSLDRTVFQRFLILYYIVTQPKTICYYVLRLQVLFIHMQKSIAICESKKVGGGTMYCW